MHGKWKRKKCKIGWSTWSYSTNECFLWLTIHYSNAFIAVTFQCPSAVELFILSTSTLTCCSSVPFRSLTIVIIVIVVPTVKSDNSVNYKISSYRYLFYIIHLFDSKCFFVTHYAYFKVLAQFFVGILNINRIKMATFKIVS